MSYSCLQLVPQEFYNILLIAFHSNPIGGHMNAYRTLHCLRPWYHWPGMYSYIKRMCNACPSCALANPTKSKSSKLVYNFPIKVPFLVLFIDVYSTENTLALMAWRYTWLHAACRKPPRYVPYKCTYVPYDGTFGASDQGQTLDVWGDIQQMSSRCQPWGVSDGDLIISTGRKSWIRKISLDKNQYNDTRSHG